MEKVTAIFKEKENRFIFNESSDKSKSLVVGQVQSGKTAFMIEQSIEALSRDYDLAIILGGTNNNLLTQTQKRFKKSFKVGDYHVFDSSDRHYGSVPKDKSVIVCLKGTESLRKLLSLLENSFLGKVIIFDDESDFGGIDVSSDGEGSAIFNLINEIYNYIDNVTFVSVTATPFADILTNNSRFDEAFALVPNKEYTGAKFFEESNIYEIIEVKEKSIEPQLLTDILEDHINRLISFGRGETQMLINSSMKTLSHIDFSVKVRTTLENFKIAINSMNFINIDKAEEIIEELINNIFILNQENTNLNIESKHSIIIGGALVSRGYTFRKLVTTVLLNEPSGKDSADTLLQRARWFGYRKEDQIYNYMKVYISKKTYDSLIECRKLTEIIYELIENKRSTGEIKDILNKTEYKNIKPTNKAWKKN